MERKYYYGKRERSRKNPSAYLSLIIDGMDQAKTNLPHFTGRLPKNIKATDLLKTHVTGVISHGHGGFHTFVDLNEYPHDPNLTLNVLLKMLKRSADENENQLPPTLYIQADNCARENKNRYVLAFCELLVRERIFTEVHLSFLYVGHTHEDVDAGFSQIAEKLRKTDVETVSDLVEMLPKCEVLTDIFDIKSWLSPYMEDISGVSGPLHFKFQLVSDSVANFYKGQHSSVWMNMENILRSVPTGKASVQKPDYSKIDCPKLIKQVEHVKELFKKVDSQKTWSEFYSAIENGQRETASRPEWILKTLPRQTAIFEENIELPENIRKLIEKDTNIPKTVIKTKSKRQQKSTGRNGIRGKSAKDKRPQQSVKNKSSAKGTTRRRVMSRSTFMLIPLSDDIKKHTWLLIFLDLIGNCLLLCLLLVFILVQLRLFCILELLNYLRLLFLSLLLEHTGSCMATVCKSHINFELFVPTCFI